jgi:hypothetical protein
MHSKLHEFLNKVVHEEEDTCMSSLPRHHEVVLHRNGCHNGETLADIIAVSCLKSKRSFSGYVSMLYARERQEKRVLIGTQFSNLYTACAVRQGETREKSIDCQSLAGYVVRQHSMLWASHAGLEHTVCVQHRQGSPMRTA